jgi:hypothetical protein
MPVKREGKLPAERTGKPRRVPSRAWIGIYQPVPPIIRAREDLICALQPCGEDLPTLESRIREMVDQLLLAGTQYYESPAWAGLIEERSRIQLYETGHWDGRGGGIIWGIVLAVLIAIGLGVTLARWRRWETLLLGLWLAVPAAILLITNPLPFQRYYIVLIAPWSVLAGFAALPITSSDFLGSVRKFLMRRDSVAKSD